LYARDNFDDPTDGADCSSEFAIISPDDLQSISSSPVAVHVHDDPTFFDSSLASQQSSNESIVSKNVKFKYPM
jgi:hypothetical protein